MRRSIIAVLLSTGALALGACATTSEPSAMTMAERAPICDPTRALENPTDCRETGRSDTLTARDRLERLRRAQGLNSTARVQLNTAIDRNRVQH